MVKTISHTHTHTHTHTTRIPHHDREGDRDGLVGLDGPEHNQTENLDGSEQVDTIGAHMAQVHVVWLVLGWHEPDGKSVHKLHPAQRGHTHVEEDAIQHRHRDELGSHKH